MLRHPPPNKRFDTGHWLRAEFSELVQQEDYADALRTGERIETLFPDSALAEQFNSIRPHLQRRAKGSTAQESTLAV